MEFNIGDWVIVANPVNGYERYLNVIGCVKEAHSTMCAITISNDRLLICYNKELQLTKNHIVVNILKDL